MTKKYNVILADPPWHFQNWNGAPGEITPGQQKRGSAQSHYPTMSNDDIYSLAVPAADNCALFLWACWPLLPESMETIRRWGFEYKTIAWVWVKLNKNSMGFFQGMGYYTRANTEPCLLATRGKITKPKARDVQALICSPIREHSRKPDEQYAKIEALYPNADYLEMFARRRHKSWDVFGNEVEGSIEL